MINGGTMAMANFYVSLIIYDVVRFAKMPKRVLFQKIVRRIKKRLKK
jgi:hypothetical protein